MLFALKLRYARLRYLVLNMWAALMGRSYVVYSTPNDFKWWLMRKHNQRRERGNVQRYLGRRSGAYNATG
jgi:hypothetical protein